MRSSPTQPLSSRIISLVFKTTTKASGRTHHATYEIQKKIEKNGRDTAGRLTAHIKEKRTDKAGQLHIYGQGQILRGGIGTRDRHK